MFMLIFDIYCGLNAFYYGIKNLSLSFLMSHKVRCFYMYILNPICTLSEVMRRLLIFFFFFSFSII